MKTFKDIIRNRRSYREYLPKLIEADYVSEILKAALLSPTSHNRQSWQFLVVDNPTDLQKLSDCKEHGASFLKQAPLAIVILGNPIENDCWIEDCSIAAFAMQLQAEELKLGTCWIQVRNRGINNEITATEIIRGILNIPEPLEVLCILAIGYPQRIKSPKNEEEIKWEQIHIEKYSTNL